MSIVLVRHGETPGNATKVVQVASTPLNDVGLHQAELLAARLANIGAKHLMCSDLPRARMTAEPVARSTGLAIELCEILQERNFGDYRGRPWSSFPEGHPYAPDLVPPHGETWDMFHARADRAFDFVLQRRREIGGTIIVITHGLMLRSMTSRRLALGALQLPAGFDNASVTTVEDQAPYAVIELNDVGHLDHIPRNNGVS